MKSLRNFRLGSDTFRFVRKQKKRRQGWKETDQLGGCWHNLGKEDGSLKWESDSGNGERMGLGNILTERTEHANRLEVENKEVRGIK